MKRFVTYIVILTFLIQNFSWAGGANMLSPDSKRNLGEIAESLGLDPMEQSLSRLEELVQRDIDSIPFPTLILIYRELLREEGAAENEVAIKWTLRLLEEGRIKRDTRLIRRTFEYFRKIKKHDVYNSLDYVWAPAAIFWKEGARVIILKNREPVDDVMDIVILPKGDADPRIGRPLGMGYILQHEEGIEKIGEDNVINLAGRVLANGESFAFGPEDSKYTYYIYEEGENISKLLINENGYVVDLCKLESRDTALRDLGDLSLIESVIIASIVNQEIYIDIPEGLREGIDRSIRFVLNSDRTEHPVEVFFNKQTKDTCIADVKSGDVVIIDRNSKYSGSVKKVNLSVLFAHPDHEWISEKILKNYTRPAQYSSWRGAAGNLRDRISRLKGKYTDIRIILALASWVPEYISKRVLWGYIGGDVLERYIARSLDRGYDCHPDSPRAPVRFYPARRGRMLVLCVGNDRFGLNYIKERECWRGVNNDRIFSILHKTLRDYQFERDRKYFYTEGNTTYIATVRYNEVIDFVRVSNDAGKPKPGNESFGIAIDEDRERSHRIIRDAFTTKKHFEAVSVREIPEFMELIEKAETYLEEQGDERAADIRETKFFAIKSKALAPDKQPLFMWIGDEGRFQIGHPGTGIKHKEMFSYLTYGFFAFMKQKYDATGDIEPMAKVLAYEAKIAREKLAKTRTARGSILDRTVARLIFHKPETRTEEDFVEAVRRVSEESRSQKAEVAVILDLIREKYGVDIKKDWEKLGSLEQSVISEYGDVDGKRWAFPAEFKEILEQGEFCAVTYSVLEELNKLDFDSKKIPLSYLASLLSGSIKDDILREKALYYIRRFLFRIPDSGIELFLEGLRVLYNSINSSGVSGLKDITYVFILSNQNPIIGHYKYKDNTQGEIPLIYFSLDWLLHAVENAQGFKKVIEHRGQVLGRGENIGQPDPSERRFLDEIRNRTLSWRKFRQYTFKDFITVSVDRRLRRQLESKAEEIREFHFRRNSLRTLWNRGFLEEIIINIEPLDRKRKPRYYFREGEDTLSITYYLRPEDDVSKILEEENLDQHVTFTNPDSDEPDFAIDMRLSEEIRKVLLRIFQRHNEYGIHFASAHRYIETKNFPRAEEELRYLQKNFPNALGYDVLILLLYLRTERYGEAMELFTKVKGKKGIRTNRPGVKMTLRSLISVAAKVVKDAELGKRDIAERHIALQRMIEIKELFEEALSLYKGRGERELIIILEIELKDVISALINDLEGSNDTRDMEMLLLCEEKQELKHSTQIGNMGADERNESIKETLVNLVNILIYRGRQESYDLAERYLKRGFLMFGASCRELQLCALESALLRGDAGTVERYMEEMDMRDNYYKGRLYLIKGDLKEAIGLFRRMKSNEHNFEISRLWLAVCLYKQARTDSADKNRLLNEASELLNNAAQKIGMNSGYYPFIFYYLGLVLYELGDLQGACAYIRWAMECYEEGETPLDFDYGVNELLSQMEGEIGRVDIFSEFSLKPPNWKILIQNRYNRLLLQHLSVLHSEQRPWKAIKEMARCLVALDIYDVAFSYLKDIPDGELSTDAFISLCISYINLWDFDGCGRLIERFIRIKGMTKEVKIALGKVYTKMEHLEKARDYYNSALKEDDANFDARAGLAVIYCYMARFDLADIELGKMDEKCKGDEKRLEVLRKKAGNTKTLLSELEEQFNTNPSIDTCMPLIKQFPYHKGACLFLGEKKFAEENHIAALGLFARATVASPDDPEPYYKMAFCYRKQNEKEEEINNLKKAFDLGHNKAGEELGAILLDRRDFNGALAVYSRLSNKIGIAKANLGLGRYQDAIGVCDTILAEQPDNTDAVIVKAECLIGLKRFRSAEDLLDRHPAVEAPNLRAAIQAGIEEEAKFGNIRSLMDRIGMKIRHLNRIRTKDYFLKIEAEIEGLLAELKKLDDGEYQRLKSEKEKVKQIALNRISKRVKRLMEKGKILASIHSVRDDIKKLFRLKDNPEDMDAGDLERVKRILEKGLRRCDECDRDIAGIRERIRENKFYHNLVMVVELSDTCRMIDEKRREISDELAAVYQALFRKTTYRDFEISIEERGLRLKNVFKLDEDKAELLTLCRRFEETHKAKYPVVSMWIKGLIVRIESAYKIARYRRDENRIRAMDGEIGDLLEKYKDRYKSEYRGINRDSFNQEFRRELGEILDYYGQNIRYEFNRKEKEEDAIGRLTGIIGGIDEEFRRRYEDRQSAIRRDADFIKGKIEALWREKFGSQGKIHNKLTLEIIERREIDAAGGRIVKNMEENDLGVKDYISLRQELIESVGKRMRQIDTLRLVRSLIVMPEHLRDKLRESAESVLEDKKRMLPRDEEVNAKGRYRKLTGNELIVLVKMAKEGNEIAEGFIIDSYDREIFYTVRKTAAERVSFYGGEEHVQAGSYLSDNVDKYFRYGCDLIAIAVGNTKEDKDPEKIDNYIKKWLQFGMLTILREEIIDGLTGAERIEMRRAARAAAMLGEGASTADIADIAGVSPAVVEDAQKSGQLGVAHLDGGVYGEAQGESVGGRKYGQEDPAYAQLEDEESIAEAKKQAQLLLEGILTDEKWEWEEENGNLDGWDEAEGRKKFIWNLFYEHLGWNEDCKGFEPEEIVSEGEWRPELERKGIGLSDLKEEFLKIRLYLYLSGNFIDYGFDINEIRAYSEEALKGIYQYLQGEGAQIWISAYELVRILISRNRDKTRELADRVFDRYMEKTGKDLGLSEILEELKEEIGGGNSQTESSETEPPGSPKTAKKVIKRYFSNGREFTLKEYLRKLNKMCGYAPKEWKPAIIHESTARRDLYALEREGILIVDRRGKPYKFRYLGNNFSQIINFARANMDADNIDEAYKITILALRRLWERGVINPETITRDSLEKVIEILGAYMLRHENYRPAIEKIVSVIEENCNEINIERLRESIIDTALPIFLESTRINPDTGHIFVYDEKDRLVYVFDRYGNCIESYFYVEDIVYAVLANVKQTKGAEKVILIWSVKGKGMVSVLMGHKNIGHVSYDVDGNVFIISTFYPVGAEKDKSFVQFAGKGIAETVFNWLINTAKRNKEIDTINLETNTIPFVRLCRKYLGGLTLNGKDISHEENDSGFYSEECVGKIVVYDNKYKESGKILLEREGPNPDQYKILSVNGNFGLERGDIVIVDKRGVIKWKRGKVVGHAYKSIRVLLLEGKPNPILLTIPPDKKKKQGHALLQKLSGERREREFYREIVSQLGITGTVLDIGCSNNTKPLEGAVEANKGNTGIGVDVEDIYKISIYKGTRIQFRIANAHELPFENETAGAVIFNRSLYHIGKSNKPTNDFNDNLASALTEAHRVLAPGGFLIIRPESFERQTNQYISELCLAQLRYLGFGKVKIIKDRPRGGSTLCIYAQKPFKNNYSFAIFGLSPVLISMLGFVACLLWTEHGGWWRFRHEVMEYVGLWFRALFISIRMIIYERGVASSHRYLQHFAQKLYFLLITHSRGELCREATPLHEDKTKLIREIYPDLVRRIRGIYPKWKPISVGELCNIVSTGKVPSDWPRFIRAMRADGIIDEEDFRVITAIGEAVEEATQGTALSIDVKVLMTEVIAIRVLIASARSKGSNSLTRSWAEFLKSRTPKSYTGMGGDDAECNPIIAQAFENGAQNITNAEITTQAKAILLEDERFAKKDSEFVASIPLSPGGEGGVRGKGFRDVRVMVIPDLPLDGHYGMGGETNEHTLPTIYVPKKLYDYLLERHNKGDPDAHIELADYIYHKYVEMRLSYPYKSNPREYKIKTEQAHRIVDHSDYEKENQYLTHEKYSILKKARGKLLEYIFYSNAFNQFNPIADVFAHLNYLFYNLEGGDVFKCHDFTLVSCDSKTAYANAEEFYEHLQELQRIGRLPDVIIVREWGIGNGRYAADFLDRLLQLDNENNTDYYGRIKYILGDFSERMLSDARSKPYLERHKDVTEFELLDATDLSRIQKGTTLLIRFNELYDDLSSNDLLYKSGDEFYRVTAKLGLDGDFVAVRRIDGVKVDRGEFIETYWNGGIEKLAELDPSFIKHIKWTASRSREKIDMEVYPYGEFIKAWAANAGDGIFPVNLGAISNLIQAFALLDKEHGGYMQFFDYGFIDNRYIAEVPAAEKILRYAGQPTVYVNFPLLRYIAETVLGLSPIVEIQSKYISRRRGENVIWRGLLDMRYKEILEETLPEFRDLEHAGQIEGIIDSRERVGSTLSKILGEIEGLIGFGNLEGIATKMNIESKNKNYIQIVQDIIRRIILERLDFLRRNLNHIWITRNQILDDPVIKNLLISPKAKGRMIDTISTLEDVAIAGYYHMKIAIPIKPSENAESAESCADRVGDDAGANPKAEQAFTGKSEVDITNEDITTQAKAILLKDEIFARKDSEFVARAGDEKGFKDVRVIVVPDLPLDGHYGMGGETNEHTLPTIYVPKILYDYLLKRHPDSCVELADYLYHKYVEMRLVQLGGMSADQAHWIVSHGSYNEKEKEYISPDTHANLSRARERLLVYIRAYSQLSHYALEFVKWVLKSYPPETGERHLAICQQGANPLGIMLKAAIEKLGWAHLKVKDIYINTDIAGERHCEMGVCRIPGFDTRGNNTDEEILMYFYQQGLLDGSPITFIDTGACGSVPWACEKVIDNSVSWRSIGQEPRFVPMETKLLFYNSISGTFCFDKLGGRKYPIEGLNRQYYLENFMIMSGYCNFLDNHFPRKYKSPSRLVEADGVWRPVLELTGKDFEFASIAEQAARDLVFEKIESGEFFSARDKIKMEIKEFLIRRQKDECRKDPNFRKKFGEKIEPRINDLHRLVAPEESSRLVDLLGKSAEGPLKDLDLSALRNYLLEITGLDLLGIIKECAIGSTARHVELMPEVLENLAAGNIGFFTERFIAANKETEGYITQMGKIFEELHQDKDVFSAFVLAFLLHDYGLLLMESGDNSHAVSGGKLLESFLSKLPLTSKQKAVIKVLIEEHVNLYAMLAGHVTPFNYECSLAKLEQAGISREMALKMYSLFLFLDTTSADSEWLREKEWLNDQSVRELLYFAGVEGFSRFKEEYPKRRLLLLSGMREHIFTDGAEVGSAVGEIYSQVFGDPNFNTYINKLWFNITPQAASVLRRLANGPNIIRFFYLLAKIYSHYKIDPQKTEIFIIADNQSTKRLNDLLDGSRDLNDILSVIKIEKGRVVINLTEDYLGDDRELLISL